VRTGFEVAVGLAAAGDVLRQKRWRGVSRTV